MHLVLKKGEKIKRNKSKSYIYVNFIYRFHMTALKIELSLPLRSNKIQIAL